MRGGGVGEKRRKQPARKLDSLPTTPNQPLDSCHVTEARKRQTYQTRTDQTKPTWNKNVLDIGSESRRRKAKEESVNDYCRLCIKVYAKTKVW